MHCHREKLVNKKFSPLAIDALNCAVESMRYVVNTEFSSHAKSFWQPAGPLWLRWNNTTLFAVLLFVAFNSQSRISLLFPGNFDQVHSQNVLSLISTMGAYAGLPPRFCAGQKSIVNDLMLSTLDCTGTVGRKLFDT